MALLAASSPPSPARAPGAASVADRLARAERALGAALTLVLLILHGRFLIHAGGLWRDEVQIVNLASTPDLRKWWAYNEHDTFPVLWQVTLRAWTALGGGRTDLGLRLLGLLVGLGILLALWRAARRLGAEAPLLALTLFALNPAVIRYGDSLRGYGLGTLTLLLMVPALWELARAPTRGQALRALGLVLLGAHTMHFNSVLLLALSGGAVAVSLQRRRLRPAAYVLLVGAVAALSIAPYLDPIGRQARWRSIVLYPSTLRWLLWRFVQILTDAGDAMPWVWLGLLLAVPAACLWRLRRGPWREQALFLAVSLWLSLAGYAAFLRASGLETHRWYYVPILGFLALGLDALIDLLVRPSPTARLLRLGGVGLALPLLVPSAWRQVEVRMTNLDVIAAELLRRAGPDDLIVVNPWWYGVTFARSYRGAAPWTTLPEMPDLYVQRFDLMRAQMAAAAT